MIEQMSKENDGFHVCAASIFELRSLYWCDWQQAICVGARGLAARIQKEIALPKVSHSFLQRL
jgi:hypothetical protein